MTIEECMKYLATCSPDDCVSIKIFMNCEGYEIKYNFRSAEKLKQGGISMRNVKGEFIK